MLLIDIIHSILVGQGHVFSNFALVTLVKNLKNETLL